MELTSSNIIGYLLDNQLVAGETVLSGELYWKKVPAKNNVFIVRKQYGNGLFLKQIQIVDDENVRLMQQAATARHILTHFKGYEPLRPFIPEFLGYDERKHLLISECIEDAMSVFHITERGEQLSASQARAMAHILSALHVDVTSQLDIDSSFRFFDQRLPWILGFPNALDYAPEVVLQNIRQDDFLLYKLDKMAHEWHIKTLVHGDVKLTNFIARQAQGEDQLKLVDWELANIGDPLWDLAGLLHSYVVSGLSYMTASSTHYQLPASKSFWEEATVCRIWQIIWHEYTKKLGWSANEAEEAALKTVGYVAARLIQSAAELNRVRPEFLAPSAWALIEEARRYFKQPYDVINRLNL